MKHFSPFIDLSTDHFEFLDLTQEDIDETIREVVPEEFLKGSSETGLIDV